MMLGSLVLPASITNSYSRVYIMNPVEAHSCVDTDSEMSLNEQYTTVYTCSRAGRFDPKVCVNCLQDETSYNIL